MPKINGPPTESVKRFWSHVSKNGPIHSSLGACWIWTEPLWGKDKYARIRVLGVRILVHRFSWWIHNGIVPDELCVLHRCDNPVCVNPSHLFLGTYADNNWDKVHKNRHTPCPGNKNGSYTHPERRPKGESHGCAVMSEEIVRELRSRYIPRHSRHGTNAMARELGMSQYSVWAAVTGRTWSHLS